MIPLEMSWSSARKCRCSNRVRKEISNGTKTRVRQHRGSLFIDVLLGIAVAALFAVALAGLAGMTSRSVAAARHESEAAALAKASMEQVVAVKHDDWNKVIRGNALVVVRKGSNYELQVAGTDDVQGIFTRRIKIEQVYRDGHDHLATSGTLDPYAVRVTVSVEWTEHRQPRQIAFVHYLTNWKRG